MNTLKKYKYYLLFLGLSLVSFSAFAAPSDQTFFELLTSNMFESVIETFDIKPGHLNTFQEWLLGMCFMWEFFHIYLAISSGANSLKRTFDLIFYMFVMLCFLGFIPYTQLTGHFLDDVGGKYKGQFLDIDLYNFVNLQAKSISKMMDGKKGLRDTDSLTEGMGAVNDYCSYQSDKAACTKQGMARLSPDKNGYIDPLFMADLQHYVKAKEGCADDKSVLNKDLMNPGSSSGVQLNSSSDSGMFTQLTDQARCIKNKVTKLSISGKDLAFWMSKVINIMINLIIGVLINIILVANLIELLFILIFARFLYPFLLIDEHRGKILTIIKGFVSFGLIPLLMKIGFWLTDSLLQVVLGTFFSDPLNFILKFFSSPVSGNSGTTGTATGLIGVGATIAAAPYLLSISLSILTGIMIAVGAVKIAILVRLTKMARDLFNLNLDAFVGLGSGAMRAIGQVGALVAGAVATGGLGLAAIGSVMRGGGSVPAPAVRPVLPSVPPVDPTPENKSLIDRGESFPVEIDKPIEIKNNNNDEQKVVQGKTIVDQTKLNDFRLRKIAEAASKGTGELSGGESDGKTVIMGTEMPYPRHGDSKDYKNVNSSEVAYPRIKSLADFLIDKRQLEINETNKNRDAARNDEIANAIAQRGMSPVEAEAKYRKTEEVEIFNYTVPNYKKFQNKESSPIPAATPIKQSESIEKNDSIEPIKRQTDESTTIVEATRTDGDKAQAIHRSNNNELAGMIGKAVAEELTKALKDLGLGKSPQSEEEKDDEMENKIKESADEAERILNTEKASIRNKGWWEKVKDEMVRMESQDKGRNFHESGNPLDLIRVDHNVIKGTLHASDKLANGMGETEAMTLHSSTKEAMMVNKEERLKKQLEYVLRRLDADKNEDGFNSIEDYVAARKHVGTIAKELGTNEKKISGMLEKQFSELHLEYKKLIEVQKETIRKNNSRKNQEIKEE